MALPNSFESLYQQMRQPFLVRSEGDPNPGPSAELQAMHDTAISIAMTVSDLLEDGKRVDEALNSIEAMRGHSVIGYYFIMYDTERILTKWGEGDVEVQVHEDTDHLKATHFNTGGEVALHIVR